MVARRVVEVTCFYYSVASLTHLLQAMAQLQQDFKRLHAEHRDMVRRLRTCNPPASSLGAHLLALKDPATGQLLTDAQLEAELVTFFFAGGLCCASLSPSAPL